MSTGHRRGSTATPVPEILAHWTAAGIPYCALRSRRDRQDADADIDLLVPASWLPRCRAYLRRCGFVAVPGWNPYKLAMLRYADGRATCLDLHSQAVQYGMVYMDERRMIARRVVEDGVAHLSPEDELIHLALHAMLRRGPLKLASLQRIRELLAAPRDEAYIRSHLDAFGLRAVFEAIVDWLRQAPLAPPDPAPLRRRVRRAVLRARSGNLRRYLGVWMHRRWPFKSSGGFIALVGPDGAGKSTVVNAVVARARAIPTLRVDTTYLGPWGQMRLPLVPALRKAGIIPTVAPARPGVALVKGSLFYAATFIELSYRYVTSVFFKVLKGRWIVSDRYITDLRHMYKARPIQNHEWIRRALCSMFPKPDLLIVLDNRPEVVASRKNQLTGGQIDALRQSCLEVAQTYRSEVLTTDRSPDELADVVINRMLLLRAGAAR